MSQKDSQLAQRANILNQRIADSTRAIAKASGRDSSAMKALAVITMTFLPATAIAVSPPFRAVQAKTKLKVFQAIFSMPIFNWEKHSYSADVGRSIWIFCVMAGVLTGAVLYFWRCWHLRAIWQRELSHREQEEKGSNEAIQAPLAYPAVDQLFLQGHDRAWNLSRK